jgi:hypothetical protein
MHSETGAPLIRSSQPRTGLTNAASGADQEYLALCQGARPLSILDCRPKLNALANQFTGGGYEDITLYPNATFEFLGIPNIHRVRECYLGMQSRPHGWHDWAYLTLQLLRGGAIGADRLSNGTAVLVHCTDGWDRTAQISSIVQVILDPFCRTIEGFEALVQRDWCDLGHMFGLRHMFGRKEMEQSAPIFAQFIDAVFQLMVRQRSAFEFTVEFLGFLLFHTYAQLFGDFGGCSWKERVEKERPGSVWCCTRDPTFRQYFVNPRFEAVEGAIDGIVKKYHRSAVIFGGPIFGSDVRVPIWKDDAAVDDDAVDEIENVIPGEREATPVEDPREEGEEVVGTVQFDGDEDDD